MTDNKVAGTENEWKCPDCGCEVKKFRFDYDLDEYLISLADRSFTLTPTGISDMKAIADELNEGFCPICNLWEDGDGELIVNRLTGWSELEEEHVPKYVVTVAGRGEYTELFDWKEGALCYAGGLINTGEKGVQVKDLCSGELVSTSRQED